MQLSTGMGGGMTRLQADLAVTGCAAIWGLSFLFQKAAVEHVGPCTFVAARLLLAALALAPVAWLEHRRADRPLPTAIQGRVLLAAAALLGGSLFQQVGIASATVTNTGLLTGLYVVLTPLVAWAALGRRAAIHVWAAAVASLAGVAMLGGGTIGGLGWGDGLVAVCAGFWAIHLLALDGAAVQERPVAFTALHMGLAGTGALAGALATEPIDLAGLSAAAPAIAYGGLLSNALTYVVLAIAMRHTTPAEVAVLSSLEVVVAAACGALLLGERLAVLGWAGAALMLLAGLLVQVGGYAPGRGQPPKP